ncbi:hypothetical protein EDD70_2349 [Hydrogenoanaerobacterium saccharovorans]|uniref:Uncharacterized protein n=1 Tax=Hydrogenoanaerobacterium saccharovorans TaxID=474960 RepID=A0A1H8CXU9_9FIRM|nr:hypothetical protein [Hydrogenoanaerobacterium saccharovorans]RPF43385.1 hypothetical protein EDD70_2349 [Hydrogenoanaerobacterium saccharovorans]SEN00041.1 hypothetical protein SAMN05216180_2407 [Hydrogenoanaerobacterium saccharovorans]
MILYLHPKGKAKLLDEIALESNQYLKTICTADIESLNTFVMYSQGNFLNSNYCVFYLIPYELSANQKDDLIKSIQTYKCIYSARLILILPDLQKDSELMSRVIAEDIRNLITCIEDEDILNECRQCLTENGKEFQDTAHFFAQEKINTAIDYIKPHVETPSKPIHIAVGGSLSRIGVTTQALAIYRYLEWLGLKCCYIDTSGRHMEALSALYGKPITDGTVTIENIRMYQSVPADETCNAFILDYGVLDDSNLKSYTDSDVMVLCCGTKAWELPCLADLLVKSEKLHQALMLFSFAGDSERESAANLLASITKQVFFSPYAPGIFDSKINTDFYSSLLLNQIQNKTQEVVT